MHHLEKDFNFAQYLRRGVTYGVREQVDIDWTSWMFLLVGIVVSLVVTTIAESNDTTVLFYSFSSDEMKLVSFWVITVLFVFFVGMIMLLENCREKLLVAATYNQLDDMKELGNVFRDLVLDREGVQRTELVQGQHFHKKYETTVRQNSALIRSVFGRVKPKVYMFILRMVLLLQSFIIGLTLMALLFREETKVCAKETSGDNTTARLLLAPDDVKANCTLVVDHSGDVSFLLQTLYVFALHYIISSRLVPRFSRTFYLLKAMCIDFKRGVEIVDDVRNERLNLKSNIEKFSRTIFELLEEKPHDSLEEFEANVFAVFDRFDLEQKELVTVKNVMNALTEKPFELYLTRREAKKLLKYYFIQSGITRYQFVPFCHQVLADESLPEDPIDIKNKKVVLLDLLKDLALKERTDVISRVERLYPTIYANEIETSTVMGETAIYDAREEVDTQAGEPNTREKLWSTLSYVLMFVRLVLIVALYYAFFFAVQIVEDSFSLIAGGPGAIPLLDNPVAGLTVGIIGTMLIRSSSAFTTIVVCAVSSNLISVKQGIPIVMGANIGTSLVSTVRGVHYLKDEKEFNMRAFSAEAVADVFNILNTLILLPIEVIVNIINEGNGGLLELMTEGMRPASEPGTVWFSLNTFVASLTDPLVKVFINTDGVIPDPTVAAVLGLVLGIPFLLLVLLGLIVIIAYVIRADTVKLLEDSLDYHGDGNLRSFYAHLLVGFAVTTLLQSSAVATSTLIPLVALGTIKLEELCPYTWGANVGTTFTCIVAALTVSRPEGMQIALVHLFFNIIGVVVLVPIPPVRQLITSIAKWLGGASIHFGPFQYLYVLLLAVIYPLFFVGIYEAFTSTLVVAVLGGLALVLFVGAHGLIWYAVEKMHIMTDPHIHFFHYHNNEVFDS